MNCISDVRLNQIEIRGGTIVLEIRDTYCVIRKPFPKKNTENLPDGLTNLIGFE